MRPVLVIKPVNSPNKDWLKLRLALWPTTSEHEHWTDMEEMCAQPHRYAQFLACDDLGNAFGLAEIALRTDYVNGTESSPVAFLEGIYVDSAHRGNGVARALVAAAEQWALARGCLELASDALLENTENHAMHQALGFQETERVVYFRKQLQQPVKQTPEDD